MRLLDTDTCIELRRGNPRVQERRAVTQDAVATTWMNAAELFFGASLSAVPEPNRDLVEVSLSTFPVFTPDEAAVRMFGHAKAALRRAGRAPPDADLIIAAVALSHGAILVTGNTAHFERFPRLVLEDWIRG